MSSVIFFLSFVYLFFHVSHFGFNDVSTDAKMLSSGIHALIITQGFVALTIERKSQ